LSGVVFGLSAALAVGSSASGEAAYCLDFRNDTALRIASYNNVGEFVRYEQSVVRVHAPTSSRSAIETLPPPAPDLSLPPRGSSLTYSIIEKSEERVLSGVRVIMRVQLSREASEPELRSIGEEMIRQESIRRRLNGIALFYYLPDAGAADACPLGRAVWAPKGNWDATHTVRLGDYSSHQHVVAAGSAPYRWKGRSTSVAPNGNVVMRTPPDRAADGGR
jgi:hypothetical protein